MPFVDATLTWGDAKAVAEAASFLGANGHLVTLSSQAENEFVWSNIVGDQSRPGWLGGFQPDGSAEPDGGWQWATIEPFTFTNWSSGEPNNQFQPHFPAYEESLHFTGNGGGTWGASHASCDLT